MSRLDRGASVRGHRSAWRGEDPQPSHDLHRYGGTFSIVSTDVQLIGEKMQFTIDGECASVLDERCGNRCCTGQAGSRYSVHYNASPLEAFNLDRSYLKLAGARSGKMLNHSRGTVWLCSGPRISTAHEDIDDLRIPYVIHRALQIAALGWSELRPQRCRTSRHGLGHSRAL